MKLSFGACILDDQTRELIVAGGVRHLTPKAFDLLIFLLQERPRAVSKGELHERLWPETFVTDVSLAKIVSEVRAAVGDSSESPQWIRTVHRFGYAFAGTAQLLSEPESRLQTMSGVMHWLTWSDRTARLAAGENIVGRDLEAAVCLDSPKVSRRHARIIVEGSRAVVEDLGSRNGTWVAGKRVVEQSPLRPGDRIRIGPFALTYRSADRTAQTESLT